MSKNGAQQLPKEHEEVFLEVVVFSWASSGEFWQKSFAFPKMCLLLAALPQL